jgi:alkanesulfonate monooxygenase SsuD/methylene tetrahydromethanopterin reductase-like flavin-dependent oxidoreductase (luciferase family)
MKLTMFSFPPYVHHYAEAWRHPMDMSGGIFRQPEPHVWAHEARALEAMKFDALFVGDVGGIFNSHPEGPKQALRLGTQSVQFFAPMLAQVAADAAPRLGVISTLSTVELHPWTTARLLNTMDHLTEGRAGWNVVTSANPASPKTSVPSRSATTSATSGPRSTWSSATASGRAGSPTP